jgi:hypothetical protein
MPVPTIPAPPTSKASVALPPRRQSRRLVVGIVITVVGALLGLYVYRLAVQRTPVVVIAQPVAFGQLITRADLREGELTADAQIAFVPWDAAAGLVGRTAAADLYAGQVVPPAALQDVGPPRRGEAVVGVALPVGRSPIGPMNPGAEALVIGADPSAPPLRATILRAGDRDSTGRRSVDLLTTESEAADLARVAADDKTTVVLVGRG